MSDPVNRKGASGTSGVTPEAAPEGAGEAFRGAGAATGVGGPEAGGRAEALRALATEVQAGRMDATTAVDKLVQRVLSESAAASLPPDHRARLEQVLRSQLANDPALLALQKNLG
jgi:hypothetical protein